MAIVKVCWSGGKDSTASMILHHLRGDHIKAVCYIPMLTNTIPLIRKCHYDHILDMADVFRKLGHEVHIVTGISYWDVCHYVLTKGKNKGLMRGYSLGFGYCEFRNNSKIKALDGCDVGAYDYQDIGIAYDEPRRQGQLTNEKRSILVELGYTEQEAKNLCIEYDALSPLYTLTAAKRDGCAICPNARRVELAHLISEYPESETILRQIDHDTQMGAKSCSKPYRNGDTFGGRIDALRKEGLI